MPPEPLRPGHRLSEALLLAAFLLVPLTASPHLPDQFTSVKWHVLAAVAAGWLVAERFPCASRGLPRLVVRTWPAWVALGGLVIAGSLRKGSAWATEPLLARATFLTLALAAFWYFRRTRLRLDAVRAAILAAAAIVVVLGLVQIGGFDPLPWLAAGDHRSATFGNVNMAAQFVGLSIVVLLAADRSSFGPRRRLAAELVAGGGGAYVYLVGSRSVALALAASLLALALVRRLSVGSLLRVAGGALVSTALVLYAAPPRTGPLEPAARAGKELSARMRLAVWSDTLGMIRDYPMGVGAGNFEHEFIPYALAGRSQPGEGLVFRSPHNEYLRLAAEEGALGALLLLALVAGLARELHRSPAVAGWRSAPGALLASGGVFLLVEAFFQFPFALAFPSLLAAVLLGLALACLDASPTSPERSEAGSRRQRRAGDVACVVVALAIGASVTRAAVAEHLSVSHWDDVTVLERACALDPRRVEACVEAAWLRSRAGDHAAARKALRSVLERSPSYFPAIKLLGEDLLAAGEQAAGCRYLRRYDEMFRGRSLVHERVRESCPQATP